MVITILLIIHKQCTREQKKLISIIPIDRASRKKKSLSPKGLAILQKTITIIYISIIYAKIFLQNALKMADRVKYDKMLEEEMFPHLLTLK